MNQLFLGILNKFVIPQAIHSAVRVTEVDPCRKTQKPDQDLMLAVSLEGTQDLTNFYNNVGAFLAKLVHSAVKRLPLENTVLNDLAWLDPAERLSSTVSMVGRLATVHFKNFVPEEKQDQLEEEFCLYQITKDLPDCITFHQTDVNVYWGKIRDLE